MIAPSLLVVKPGTVLPCTVRMSHVCRDEDEKIVVGIESRPISLAVFCIASYDGYDTRFGRYAIKESKSLGEGRTSYHIDNPGEE
jgi:hypothetical protein